MNQRRDGPELGVRHRRAARSTRAAGRHCQGRGRQARFGEDAARLLQTIPLPGSIPGGVPTDPTIYRFYEMVQVYGSTLKALVHEKFGDGIISAINFKLDTKKD